MYYTQFLEIAFFTTVRRTVVKMIMHPAPPNDGKYSCRVFLGAAWRRIARVFSVSVGTIVHSSALFFGLLKDNWRESPEFRDHPEPGNFLPYFHAPSPFGNSSRSSRWKFAMREAQLLTLKSGEWAMSE